MKKRKIINKWSGKVVCEYEPSLVSPQFKRLVKYLKEVDEENERLSLVNKSQAFLIATAKERA